MTTPPPVGNTQTSSQSENQRAYNALWQAKDGVGRSRADVETVMNGLINTYGGSDGTAFRELLRSWTDEVEVITRSMGDLMQKLTETGMAQTRTQSEINEFIEAAKRTSRSQGAEARLGG
ncbi:hypothetical protein [Streptomyces sp. NPDC001744]|uniref:hypothetical protein n=1 Tax=Streptomyces sp. NPDC001744 TaxID=3364606 RepID=UPI0036B3737F